MISCLGFGVAVKVHAVSTTVAFWLRLVIGWLVETLPVWIGLFGGLSGGFVLVLRWN